MACLKSASKAMASLAAASGGGTRIKAVVVLEEGIQDKEGNGIGPRKVRLEAERGVRGLYKVKYPTHYTERAMKICQGRTVEITGKCTAEFFYGVPAEVISQMTTDDRITQMEIKRELISGAKRFCEIYANELEGEEGAEVEYEDDSDDEGVAGLLNQVIPYIR